MKRGSELGNGGDGSACGCEVRDRKRDSHIDGIWADLSRAQPEVALPAGKCEPQAGPLHYTGCTRQGRCARGHVQEHTRVLVASWTRRHVSCGHCCVRRKQESERLSPVIQLEHWTGSNCGWHAAIGPSKIFQIRRQPHQYDSGSAYRIVLVSRRHEREGPKAHVLRSS